MLRMRLTRVGSKKRPAYRVVVADSRAPRDGRHVDIVGHYNPMTKPSTVNIDVERAVKWLRSGAEPSERVRVLLRHSGVLKAHEEARLSDKRARKEQPAPARPERPAAKGEAAKTPFRIVVPRAPEAAAAEPSEEAAGAPRKTRGRAGAAKGTKSATKAAKTGAAKGAAKKTGTVKSASTAKSAEKTAARKSATKASKSS